MDTKKNVDGGRHTLTRRNHALDTLGARYISVLRYACLDFRVIRYSDRVSQRVQAQHHVMTVRTVVRVCYRGIFGRQSETHLCNPWQSA